MVSVVCSSGTGLDLWRSPGVWFDAKEGEVSLYILAAVGTETRLQTEAER